jgi:hypothetical protein
VPHLAHSASSGPQGMHASYAVSGLGGRGGVPGKRRKDVVRTKKARMIWTTARQLQGFASWTRWTYEDRFPTRERGETGSRAVDGREPVVCRRRAWQGGQRELSPAVALAVAIAQRQLDILRGGQLESRPSGAVRGEEDAKFSLPPQQQFFEFMERGRDGGTLGSRGVRCIIVHAAHFRLNAVQGNESSENQLTTPTRRPYL